MSLDHAFAPAGEEEELHSELLAEEDGWQKSVAGTTKAMDVPLIFGFERHDCSNSYSESTYCIIL